MVLVQREILISSAHSNTLTRPLPVIVPTLKLRDNTTAWLEVSIDKTADSAD